MSAEIPKVKDDEMLVIPPQTDLKDRVLKPGNPSIACRKAIKAAENAIEELSVEFDGWMNSAVDELLEKLPRVHEDGLKSEAGEELHTIIHDLKGQATTLGYPVVSEICDTLCNLLEKTPDVSRISPKIAELHVRSIQTIVQECTKHSDDPKANAISAGLRQMVMKILKHEFERADKNEAEK